MPDNKITVLMNSRSTLFIIRIVAIFKSNAQISHSLRIFCFREFTRSKNFPLDNLSGNSAEVIKDAKKVIPENLTVVCQISETKPL